MCKFSEDCSDESGVLVTVPDGVETSCCATFIDDEYIGQPKTSYRKRYAAVCDECGIVETCEYKPAAVKIAARTHDESHNVNWGFLR